MLYAKCIRESQIAHSREEFIAREKEENHVYYVGEVTKAHNGMATLNCVPINFIYDCLKYGDYIAIIDVHTDNKETYVKKSSYMGLEKVSKEQRVIKIMDAYSKDTINYVFDEVKNPDFVHDGYINLLPTDLQNYFNSKKKKGLSSLSTKDLILLYFNCLDESKNPHVMFDGANPILAEKEYMRRKWLLSEEIMGTLRSKGVCTNILYLKFQKLKIKIFN